MNYGSSGQLPRRMSRSTVAYKYFLHVSAITETLTQTCTHLKTSSRLASVTAVRPPCSKHFLELQTNRTVHQKPPATYYRNFKPQLLPCNHILTLHSNLTRPHCISTSHQRPSSHLPLPQRRTQEESSVGEAARGMTTPEERNPKRPREPDSTLSPPPKKAHHKVSPRNEGSPTGTSSLPLSADQPDSTGDAETIIGSVLISEGGAVKEEFTPKGRITNNKYEERAGDERLIPDTEITTAVKCEGETGLKLVTEGGTLKHDFTPERGLKTEPKCEEVSKEEFEPEEWTDMDVSLEGKIHRELTPIEGTSKTESTNLQVDSDTQMTLSNIHSTATSGCVAPHIPSLSSLEREESISSTTGSLNEAKRVSRTEEEGRDHHGKKKKKKHSSQKSKKQNLSDEKKSVRPNYFVGIQVSNPAIHRALLKVQEDLVAWDESLVKALVDVATSHLTLLVAHLDTEESIAVASAALEESAKRLRDGISASPVNLTFAGVSNFSNQVVFAQVVEDDQHQRLLDVAECVRQVFVSHGVCMPDTRELHPHLTIAKLSKAPRTKGKHPVLRKIDPSCYRQHVDLHLGSQTVAGLQLLSMNKAKDDFRYYHSDKQVLFDVKLEEEKDHSGCCFPRRPTLPLPLRRTYSTTSTTTTPGEAREDHAPSTWLIPLAGVTTLVAGALLLGFALARIRGNH